jgi:hypothetical protein
MLYFGTRKFHKFYGCFNYCKINCSSAVSSLSNGISSMDNTPHWEPSGRIHFHITEVMPLTLRPYQAVPWTEPHYICLQLLRLSLQHTSLYSPLITQSSFHMLTVKTFSMAWAGVRDKVGSHKLNVRGLGTVAGILTGTWLRASAELDVSSQRTWVHTV